MDATLIPNTPELMARTRSTLRYELSKAGRATSTPERNSWLRRAEGTIRTYNVLVRAHRRAITGRDGNQGGDLG